MHHYNPVGEVLSHQPDGFPGRLRCFSSISILSFLSGDLRFLKIHPCCNRPEPRSNNTDESEWTCPMLGPLGLANSFLFTECQNNERGHFSVIWWNSNFNCLAKVTIVIFWDKWEKLSSPRTTSELYLVMAASCTLYISDDTMRKEQYVEILKWKLQDIIQEVKAGSSKWMMILNMLIN